MSTWLLAAKVTGANVRRAVSGHFIRPDDSGKSTAQVLNTSLHFGLFVDLLMEQMHFKNDKQADVYPDRSRFPHLQVQSYDQMVQ